MAHVEKKQNGRSLITLLLKSIIAGLRKKISTRHVAERTDMYLIRKAKEIRAKR
jgi:hypothetical protein